MKISIVELITEWYLIHFVSKRVPADCQSPSIISSSMDLAGNFGSFPVRLLSGEHPHEKDVVLISTKNKGGIITDLVQPRR